MHLPVKGSSENKRFMVQAFYGFENFKIRSCITVETFLPEDNQDKEEETEEKILEREKCASVHGLLVAYSSVVLTHALLVTLERLVAGFLSRGVKVCTLL